MPKFERVNDPWKDLRKDLFGNVEPTVELEAITMPVDKWLMPGMGYINKGGAEEKDGFINWKRIEELPAIAAGVSYGSKDKIENDHDRAIKLNKKLIEMGHHTPLESIQINLFVSGISKACGAQISRHRCGQGHVSASRRFQSAGAGFIYPVLDYMDETEEYMSVIYGRLEYYYKSSFDLYQALRTSKETNFHKEDARMVLPVSYATERSWWINVRALRDFFRLRLAADAEWEIRRLAWVIFDLVEPLLSSLFEDILWEKTSIMQVRNTSLLSDPGYVGDYPFEQCCECKKHFPTNKMTYRHGFWYCKDCVPRGIYDG